MASPWGPARWFRSSRPSDLVWPMTGSTSPSEFAADGGRGDAAHPRDEDAGFALVSVSLIAAIDISAFDGNAGEALDLLDLAGEGVAVIRAAG